MNLTKREAKRVLGAFALVYDVLVRFYQDEKRILRRLFKLFPELRDGEYNHLWLAVK